MQRFALEGSARFIKKKKEGREKRKERKTDAREGKGKIKAEDNGLVELV